MEVKFTENKLIELFLNVDDLHKSYIAYQQERGMYLPNTKLSTHLNGPEICTILVAYHYSGYKCFEYYYRELILNRYASYFPDAPSYEGFLSYIPKSADLVYLWLLYSVTTSQRTGLYFIDSKKLQVCHLRREKSNKVFKDIAKKGKTSTGWFFGLKIHLVINNLGQIVAFELTTGNVADNNQQLLMKLLQRLNGVCVGDKGYLTKLFDFFYENGLHLMTKPKKNMRQLPVDQKFNPLINKRAVVESVFDILSSICNIEHSRHRKPMNACVHILSALIAYQYLDQKPQVFFPSIKKQTRLQAA